MKEVPTTVGDTADQVWRMEWSQQKSASVTVYNMEAVVDFFGDDTELSDVSSSDVDSFILHLRETNSPATINRKLSVLSKIMKYGVDNGVINRKPRISKQREPAGRLKYYTREEEFDMSQKMQPALRDLFLFLIDTGLRRGEALSLTWRDTPPYEKHIVLSDPEKIKNGKPRTVPLTNRAYDILSKRRHGPASEGPFGFTNQRVDDMIKEFRKVHDFDCRLLHTCRHTFCSRLVQSGVPLAVVKELAGHSDLQTTLRYAHLTSENLSDAIKTMEAQGG